MTKSAESAPRVGRPSKYSHATIYALVCPETGRVRYVGKANDPRQRLAGHLKDSLRKNLPVNCWIRSLAARGLGPRMEILEVVPFERWAEAERRWIAKYRAESAGMLNLSDGGGAPYMTQEQGARAARAATAARSKDARSKRLWELRRDLGATIAWLKKHNPAGYERIAARLRPYVISRPELFAGIKAL